MEYIEEGKNSRIYSLNNASVQKVLKEGSTGHDLLTQKRIHHLLSRVIDELSCSLFRVPKLIESYPQEYCMEYVDTSNAIFLGMLCNTKNYTNYLNEFLEIWRAMWFYGFALYDFELYLQKDGTIMIIDFDKTGFRMTSGPQLFSFPIPFQNQDYIFEHPCFPQNFLPRLLKLNEHLSQKEMFEYLSHYPYREKAETRNPA